MSLGDKLPVVMGREKAAAGGVATLGADGILAEAQRPSAGQIMTEDGNSVETALTVVGAPSGGIEGQALVSTGTGSASRVKWGPWPSNPNLLGNWYFVGGGSQQGGGQFPINQRGKTEYSFGVGGLYAIDRWLVGKGTTVLDSSGVKLIWDGTSRSQSYLAQKMEPSLFNSLIGKTMTASTLTYDNQLYTFTFVHTNTSKTYGPIDGVGFLWEKDFGLNLRSYDSSDGVTFVAAKLELGPVQTLAHKEGDTWVLNDPPPNFQQELAKCQRRQICFGKTAAYEFFGIGIASNTTSLSIIAPLPTTLKGTPSISFSGRISASIDNNTFIDFTDKQIFVNSISSNSVNIVVMSTTPVFTAGSVYNIICFPGAKFILDSNL